MGDNPLMDISQEQVDRLEALLGQLAEVDPADLPEPASELARILGEILDQTEGGE